MAYITSRKHVVPAALFAPAATALTLMAWQPAACAQQEEPALAAARPDGSASPGTLPAVKARVRVHNDYKADVSASPKFTQPLADTPQTITIIKKEILAQQGATSLSEALRNTPGITFQMGENGNTQTGDSIFMRGFDTQQSIFVDGIRDLGTLTRDVYNLDQIEVVKGPAGADIGRGSPSGYVNLSTKVPVRDDFSQATATVGSGEHKRVTLDMNRMLPSLGEGAAARLNFMQQDSGAVGRDQVAKKGWGLAPSLALGLNTPMRTFLYYQHVEQNNRPDGGIPAIGLPGFSHPAFNASPSATYPAGGPAALAGITSPSRVDEHNFYGSASDFDQVKADMFTVRLENDLRPGVTLRNTSRIGRTEQRYVLTGTHITAASTGLLLTDPANPATWQVLRTRQGKDQENLVLTHQTHLTADFETAGLKHALASGLEFIYERQNNITMGQIGASTYASLYSPNADDVLAEVRPTGASTDGSTVTAAAYAFDTVKLTDRIQLSGGLRWERYKTEYDAVSLSTAAANPLLPVGTRLPTHLAKADDLLTWKLGALYKPTVNGSVYLAYATSRKPPGSDSFALNSSATSINSPNLDPATSSSLELGTKWELLDKRMALTAAMYQSKTRNDVVDTDLGGAPVQTGKKTVNGIEVGAAGMLSPAWQLSTGLAWMDTEIKATTAANSALQQGSALAWSPRLSFTSWSTYRLPFGLTVGGGARYMQSVVRSSNNNVSTVAGAPGIPSYWLFDAMASYGINRNVSLQLNLYNLADKFHVQGLNNGGNRYALGTPRSASLSATVKF